MKSITDLNAGDHFEIIFTITEDLHNGFMALSGDDSPIHSDVEFCKNNGFPERLGYAFLITTLLSQIYGKHFPGGSELCLSQSTNFKKPFFVNDKLKFRVEVSGINEAFKVLNTRVTVYNQRQDKIFFGDGILKLCLE